MRNKKAKSYRRKAESFGVRFVEERVLPPEEMEKLSYKQAVDVVPNNIYFRKNNSVHMGIGTKRWFYKRIKQNPNVSYEECMKIGGLE